MRKRRNSEADDCFLHKKTEQAKLVPTWVQGPDLIPATSGLSFKGKPLKAALRYPKLFVASCLADSFDRYGACTTPASATGSGAMQAPTSTARRSHNPARKKHLPKQVPIWVQGPDLNRRPPGYEPDELPSCSTLRYL